MWDFGNFCEAFDNFCDTMNQERSTVKKVAKFTKKDLLEYTESVMKESYEVCKSKVSVMKKSEMGEEHPANDYWVIRQVFLNEAEAPVRYPDTKDSFYGRIVYADNLDREFTEFMNGKKMKTFKISRRD